MARLLTLAVLVSLGKCVRVLLIARDLLGEVLPQEMECIRPGLVCAAKKKEKKREVTELVELYVQLLFIDILRLLDSNKSSLTVPSVSYVSHSNNCFRTVLIDYSISSLTVPSVNYASH